VAVRRHDAVVNLLGSSKVVLLGIDKVTQVHVLDVHGEGERLIGRESATVDGEGDLGRWHVVRRDDLPHWNSIAAPGFDLGAIRQRLTEAVVNEVVVGGEGSSLTGNWRILTILLATSANDGGVEGE